jgi:hypothetical protein
VKSPVDPVNVNRTAAHLKRWERIKKQNKREFVGVAKALNNSNALRAEFVR